MRRYALIPVFAALVLSGCTSFGPMTPPDVALVNLEFTDLTVFETTGRVTVRITNENPEPLVVQGSVFKLFLNGVPVGKALASERVEIPRLGTQTQTIELFINNVALIARLAVMLDQPELDYRIKSKLWVERPYGTRRVRLQHEGKFSFGDQAIPGAERIDEVAPSHAHSGIEGGV